MRPVVALICAASLLPFSVGALDAQSVTQQTGCAAQPAALETALAGTRPGLPTTITTTDRGKMSGGFDHANPNQIGIRDLAGRIHEFAFQEVKKVSLQKPRTTNQIQIGIVGLIVSTSFFTLFESVPKRPVSLFALASGLLAGSVVLLIHHPHQTVYESCGK
jgi:hypothetical protein